MFGRSRSRYVGEPVPSERQSASTDELAHLPTLDGTDATGTGVLGVPERNRGASIDYHRAPIGVVLTLPPQDPGIGAELHQAGRGRAHVPARLAFPVQSPTPEPDRRRIARPMPTASRDDAEVIRRG